MTDPSRGVRVRRVNRRPGWVLLTVLLVLAIVASTVLVFTNRVELLKLAVVLALWAAVAAAFVSFIYRRQSDLDQAKVRDLKYVYDLQLDREISARREYELAVEAQLRRELTAELRAQAADEVAALRAELAALRTNLEILFDTDLEHRPALETDRPAGRVIASRIDTPVRRAEAEPRTEESPIIDVPAEPHPPEYQWAPAEPIEPELFGGAHRRASETEDPAPWQRRAASSPPAPPPTPPPAPAADPAAAQWSPPPAGNWEPQPAPPLRQPEPAPRPAPEPAGTGRPAPPRPDRQGRHSGSDAESTPPPRRARHAVPGEAGPPPAPPRTRRAASPDREPPSPPVPAPAPPPVPRHRSAEERQLLAEQQEPEGGQHAGGQPVSELLSRLHATPTGGGRRRRREE